MTNGIHITATAERDLLRASEIASRQDGDPIAASLGVSDHIRSIKKNFCS